MTRAKGRLSHTALDRDWPHQVMVSARVAAHPDPAGKFCAVHSLSVSGQQKLVRRDDKDHLVYCFKHADDAELFAAQFNGEPVTPPKARPTNWGGPRKPDRL